MKIKFNKYVELLLLWIALGGLVARQWIMPDISWQVQTLLFIMSFIMLNLVWIFHYQFNEWLNQRMPFEKNVRWRIVVQLLGGWTIVKTVAVVAGYFIALRFFPPALTLLNKFGFIIIGMMIFLVNTIICLGFIASHLLRRWQENALRTAQLEKEKVQVQLDSLKNQVSPHFLFNSLSSLDSLIDDNPVLARQFLQQLSKVFRYVLQHKEKALVPLETELAFIKNYISLLHTRFDGAFVVKCEVNAGAMEQLIVPVTLQILIENAIKHNVISEARPLTITMSSKDGYLSVTNPLQRKRQVETSNRQGLENLKLLYSFLSQKSVEVIETDALFQVRLPLIDIAN
ncbi:sensor histidine kinase [Spirosoma fluviale]|uniref:Histidine kinase n=1 Tax=Spirosoma fluviale TaxID=1597977 RepID=A0A286FES0_9BACT|nr:histidine kinase [Spirosoma fluviale]SOD81708.1 Histidine kinase [Spirosoma fluviale]